MERKIKDRKTQLKRDSGMIGENMITKMERILTSGEPIIDSAPAIYQDADAGVDWKTNIRTDRFEEASESADKLTKTKIAKREEAINSIRNPQKTE